MPEHAEGAGWVPPELEFQDVEALRFLLEVQDDRHEEISAEIEDILRDDPEFGPLIAATPKEESEASGIESRRRLRVAVETGGWDDYVSNLKVEGATYANIGISLAGWFKAISCMRGPIVRMLFESFDATMPVEKRAKIIGATDALLDLVLRVMSDSYLDAKQDLILAQQRQLEETQARELDELRRLDTAKSQFVVMATHELRTPLTTLTGYALTLSENWKNLPQDDLEGSFEAMGRQARKLQAMVKNLLDISRIDMDQMPLSLESIPLKDAVRDALEAAPPPEDWSVELDLDGGCVVTADADRLREVLINLFGNAYRYGSSPLVIAEVTEAEPACLRVFDGGPGLTEALTEHEDFELFQRGALVENIPGSGLGLALSQRLMRKMGGDLRYVRTGEGDWSFELLEDAS